MTELNDCVRAVDLIRREIETVCAGFQHKNGLKDGDAREALMNFPYGIAEVEAGKRYVITESDNHSLRVLDLVDSI